MRGDFVIEEHPPDPDWVAAWARYDANARWLTQHGPTFWDRYVGQYIAASEGDIFVADDRWEAERLAKARHPDDEPFVQFVSPNRAPRIYAC